MSVELNTSIINAELVKVEGINEIDLSLLTPGIPTIEVKMEYVRLIFNQIDKITAKNKVNFQKLKIHKVLWDFVQKEISETDFQDYLEKNESVVPEFFAARSFEGDYISLNNQECQDAKDILEYLIEYYDDLISEL